MVKLISKEELINNESIYGLKTQEEFFRKMLKQGSV